MAFINKLFNCFSAGELSPQADCRTEIPQYKNGCRTLENFMASTAGHASRRPGTQYIGTAKYSSGNYTSTAIRLIELNFSDSNKFTAEIGCNDASQAGYIRFWTGGVSPSVVKYPSSGSWTLPDSVTPSSNDTVSFTSGQIVEAVPTDYLGNYISAGVPVPYLGSELNAIQYITVGNVAYLVHPNHIPLRISFYGFGNSQGFPPFTVGEIPWKWPVMTSQNTSNTKIVPATAIVSSYSAVTCSITSTTATISKGGGITCANGQTWVLASSQIQTNAALGAFVITASGSDATFTVPAGTTVPTGTLYFVRYTAISTALAAGATAYLISTTPIFASGHAHSYWELDSINPASSLNQGISGNLTTSSVAIFGSWSVATWGNWTASIDLQSSSDQVNWTTIRTYASVADNPSSTVPNQQPKNFTDSGSAAFITYYRFVISGYSATYASTNPSISITADSAVIQSWVKVNSVGATVGAVTGGNYITATASVGSTIAANTPQTTQWWEGAFNAVQGYPAAVSIHESRVIFGGTGFLPSTVWGSAVNDFQDFLQGALDSDSYMFTLASNTGGNIEWIISQGAMAIGTSQDEWLLTSSSTSSTALTPSNVSAQKQSHYGSSTVPATLVNDTILYFQRSGRRIREFSYNWQILKWISNDISAFSEQATESGIVQTAYQRVINAVLWMVRGDGQLSSMLYEKELGIVAFSRQITDGTFESVGVLTGVNAEDEVWLSVNRIVNGKTVRYIERIALGQSEAVSDADKSLWWYVDSGTRISQAVSTTISGLSYLEAKTVSVWGMSSTIGWANVGLFTVTSGSITIPYPLTNALVGLSYTSTMSPMRIAVDLQDGSSMGRKQSINELNINLFNSMGGTVSADGINWAPIVCRQMGDLMDVSPDPVNGWRRAIIKSNIDDFTDIIIQSSSPMPLTIRAISAGWEMSDQN